MLKMFSNLESLSIDFWQLIRPKKGSTALRIFYKREYCDVVLPGLLPMVPWSSDSPVAGATSTESSLSFLD